MLIRVILALVFLSINPISAMASQKETVVILHGIAKTSKSMSSIEIVLKQAGYNTINITYPSTTKSLENIAAHLRKNELSEPFWKKENTVHFVTHSMGGLVARQYLDSYKGVIPKDKLGNVVMIAPPNKGSSIADTLHKLAPYKWYYGPAGSELTTIVQSKNKSDIYYDLGIIAGKKEWPYFIAALFISGKSDGRVSVEQTKIKGMKDHSVVNGTHTFIMNKKDVHKLILKFLKSSRFSD